jgi:hypothetical protein
MFRFTIRDVLWLTVVVALSVAWFIDRSRLQALAAKLKTDSQMIRAVDGIDRAR